MTWKLTVIFLLGFAAANFGYQYIGSEHWDSAFERTYFQVFAVVAYKMISIWNDRSASEEIR